MWKADIERRIGNLETDLPNQTTRGDELAKTLAKEQVLSAKLERRVKKAEDLLQILILQVGYEVEWVPEVPAQVIPATPAFVRLKKVSKK